LIKAKLYVFVDGSFTNNKDLSSYIGYTVIIATESLTDDSFNIKGNLIYYSTTKLKRVTQSALTLEVYRIVLRVNISICFTTTLKIITEQLNILEIPLVICTDSLSLYDCLVKLSTTTEKRLMINIITLRQSYERQEIFKVQWINKKDNPADAITKATLNRALKSFLNTNRLSVRVNG
jgi:hypothetical protein